MTIGGDDTPAPPASDLWSSDVRFTLTKSVCKTSEFGDSTAGCHGDEVSWEMQVGKQARHYCPVGGGRIIKHPPPFLFPLFGVVRLLQVSLWYDACRGVL